LFFCYFGKYLIAIEVCLFVFLQGEERFDHEDPLPSELSFLVGREKGKGVWIEKT